MYASINRKRYITAICSLFLPMLLVCLTGKLYAQTPAYTIEAKALYDGNNVIIRWAPGNFDTWNWGNFHGGYDVERTKIKQNGVALSTSEISASKDTIASGLIPIPEMQWELLEDTTLAGIVAGSIYGDSIEIVDMAHADFMTVVNTTESRKNRFGYSLFACDQNLDIALAAGLAFIDTTAQENDEYIYVVKLHTLPSGASQKKGIISLRVVPALLPAPLKPIALCMDKAVILNWPKQAEYGSYLVERSNNNGQTYEIINQRPFLSLSDAAGGTDMNSFLDSLGANDVQYVYRVKGLSPFGVSGPPSDTIHAAGTPAPLVAEPYIYQITEPAAGQLKIDWEYPTNMEPDLDVFVISRASQIDGAFTFLANVPANLRTYTDQNPGGSNYYIVRAKDVNGQQVASLPKLGQGKDDTPPAAPTGLGGNCDNYGEVEIHWSKNTESDLKGYTVYFSEQNQADSNFLQITSNPVKDTAFRYRVDLNTLTENMYFAVRALDLHDNKSPFSAYYNIRRKDVVAPSIPAIVKVYPRSAAVQLDVTPSTSHDVVKYIFQKRREDSPDWETLAEFPSGQMVSTYTDSLTYLDPITRRRWYYYRLVAVDDADLESGSQAVRTKPLDQGMRGPVQNLVAIFAPGPPKRVQLTWNYAPDMDLVGFQIYRGIDNSPLRSFKFIPITSPNGIHVFIDGDTNLKVVPKKVTFLQPALAGGPPIPVNPGALNQPVNVSPNAFMALRYQVMAVFADGAQSPLSPVVQVQFQ
ncbi:MAG TPA: hypothetical protein VK168_11535 [Saprospiraceae bacterium]|nr:hypothetical protein [Saprospiraceae bacterium]